MNKEGNHIKLFIFFTKFQLKENLLQTNFITFQREIITRTRFYVLCLWNRRNNFFKITVILYLSSVNINALSILLRIHFHRLFRPWRRPVIAEYRLKSTMLQLVKEVYLGTHRRRRTNWKARCCPGWEMKQFTKS